MNEHAVLEETTFAKADFSFLTEVNQSLVVDHKFKEKEGDRFQSDHSLSHKIISEINSEYITFDAGVVLNRKKLEF